MNLWILDTDCFSLFQRGNSPVVKRVTNTRPEQLAITIVTIEEQIRGRLSIIRRSSDEKTVLAYANLKNLLQDIQQLNILDFTNEANNYYPGINSAKNSRWYKRLKNCSDRTIG